jgi:pimeloyl-ACP methyl ester carboxylesterase
MKSVTSMVHLLVALLVGSGLPHARSQTSPSESDPSPHQVRMVTVDSTVRLEVLDWGGSGPPLLFVGCYLSAHVFDEIAPKLRDQFHVYAVTRRGIGASDHPAVGYDPQRRSDDILEVIDALGLKKVLLVGNACGGHILHTLGGQHPDRVSGLVYIEAAEDPTLKLSDYAFPPVDRVNVAAFRGTQTPVTFPPAEQRRLDAQPIDPKIRKAITEDYLVRPDYAAIKVPVLALYRSTTLEQSLRDFPPGNERERAAVELAVEARRTVLARWQRDLLAGVPTARIVEVPRANLFMFLSHEGDVLREIRSFATTLPR